MKELYRQLYRDCIGYDSFTSDAHFVGMRGSQYNSSKMKLLIVGRAPNGWESLPTENEEDFSKEAEEQFYSLNRFEWIKSVNGVLYSRHCSGYCIDTKPFWTYSRAVYEQLSSNLDSDSFWMQNIAWTNLYKVSPEIEGNPDDELMKKQIRTCKEILIKELKEYVPTHVLVMTGFGWFESFSSIFDNVHDSGLRNVRGKNKVYVEGTACFNNSKVVIACRPEYRNKQEYVNDVISEFYKIDLNKR